MESIKKFAKSADKFVDAVFESSSSSDEEEDEVKKAKKEAKKLKKKQKEAARKGITVEELEAQTAPQTEEEKQRDEKIRKAGKMTGEALDLAGEIALDVVTGGIYGLTTDTVDAVDGIEKAEKAKGEELTSDEEADIVADAFTGGLYSAIGGTEEAKKIEGEQKQAAVAAKS